MVKSTNKRQVYEEILNHLAVKTDHLFIGLFIFQWLLGVAMALWISPQSWSGNTSQIHFHVYMAIFFGGAVAGLPIFMATQYAGHPVNRYIVTVAQSIFSIMYIHFTAGRIESHFHIFVSMAVLAFYRDYRPVILATLLTAVDHFARGFYWPESIYGVDYASGQRALEHVFWVLFEDVLMFVSIHNSLSATWTIAGNRVELSAMLDNVENLVEKRTEQLTESQVKIVEQQQALVAASKMSALGEMAGGVAHEINNPVGVIQGKANLLMKHMKAGSFTVDIGVGELTKIVSMTDRLSKIVKGLRTFSRNADQDAFAATELKAIVDGVLTLCAERFLYNNVKLEIGVIDDVSLDCRVVQIEQVLLNFLNNSYDAIVPMAEKWIRLDFEVFAQTIKMTVTDSGKGIKSDVAEKLMQPFFTTKEVGKGTGLGLSISKGIIEGHGGHLTYDSTCPNTRFIIELPLVQKAVVSPPAA